MGLLDQIINYPLYGMEDEENLKFPEGIPMSKEDVDIWGKPQDLDETMLSNILRTPALKKAMDKTYRDLYKKRSKKQTKGLWDFPILNTGRGKMQTHRMLKGLDKGDIRVRGANIMGAKHQDNPGGLLLGTMASDPRTPFNKRDSLMHLALKRGVGGILQTILHEGGHIPPIFGAQEEHQYANDFEYEEITKKHLTEAYDSLSREEMLSLKKQLMDFTNKRN